MLAFSDANLDTITLPYLKDCSKLLDKCIVFEDMIAVPDFAAGAMENWGLITYRENSMLYQEGVSSTADKQWTTETITHELAHQVGKSIRCIFEQVHVTQQLPKS